MSPSGGHAQDRVVFGRVAVRGSGLDSVVTRMSVEGALRDTEVSSAGLAPEAILCIRQLADPMPGRLRADRAHAAPPRGWQSALARRIEEMGRRAARPWMEPVPAAAPAVLFADRAELLACAARDLLREGPSAAWWYEEIFRGSLGRRVALQAWMEDAAHVPAALALLARRGEAVSFAAWLDSGEADSLVGALIERFGLAALHRSLADVRGGGSQTGDLGGEGARGPAGVGRGTLGGSAIWLGGDAHGARPWAPEAPETLEMRGRGTLEGTLLLGLGLTLARAPESARRSSFARTVAAFVAGTRHAPRDEASEASREERVDGSRAAAPAPEPPVDGARDMRMEPVQAPVPPASPESGGIPSALERPSGTPRGSGPPELTAGPPEDRPPGIVRAPDPDSISRTDPLEIEAIEDAVPRPASGPDDASSDGPTPAKTRAEHPGEGESSRPAGAVFAPEDPTGEPSPSPEPFVLRRVVQTRLGGLFFLVNLALYLELYGDFTTPLTPGIDLSIWDFVTLVGRALLPDEGPGDPVFGLLADLAGRPREEAPGAGFEPPLSWRVPSNWLSPFAARSHEPWTWVSDGARLTIFHPAGFCVLDAPVEADIASQLERERSPFGVTLLPDPTRRPPETEEVRAPTASRALRDASRTPRDGEDTPSLAWWLGRLMPYVRARLERALGAGQGVDPSALLLRLGATIFVSEERLDVEMSLVELPIEIRLSGLDRDPGWVPAAGRFVAFHFQPS